MNSTVHGRGKHDLKTKEPIVFQELMPLLAQRTLLLTISRINVEQISVNVIPQRLKPSETDDNNALTTPLSITGTPKELDEELPKQLVEFVGEHLGLSSTLRSAKEQMDAAAKAAKESARKTQVCKSNANAARAETVNDRTDAPNEGTEPDSNPDTGLSEPADAQMSGNLFGNANSET